MPHVLNLRGYKGIVPEGAVYIGGRVSRGAWRLPGSKWANPFRPRRGGTREEVIAQYERYVYESGLINELHELRGRNLACWCAPSPCHGDLLLRLANA